MLVIRLSRVGRENLHKFRLIVQEKARSPKSGKVLAIVGSYNPTDPENKLVFEAEQIEAFLKNGATPSDTVARLLLKNGFKKELIDKFIKKYSKQKSKKAEAEKPAEAVKQEAATPAEEKPAEEVITDEKPKEEVKTEPKEKSTKTEDSPKDEEKKNS
ncbi:30S ribosomal protein S16 [Candidatus Gracilibacteria bacterium]|nr:30S ribosomal protein S16 [Candidatus Gracilibacteria bacterium]MCF7856309.1 30S ribosomal protein S16 [Candidatus Gracilibacteria bacterium]MCF7896664.1 30S ribosomal protein S16 [Candidatus Gracilibacteria bacterium]